MRQEFVSYLVSIGMQSPLIELVDKKCRIVELLIRSIGTIEVRDIFIEETSMEDGKRNYENIIFFTDRFFIETQIFSSGNDIKIYPINKRILALQITSKDYEFEATNINSMLSVSCMLAEGGMWILTASRENCDKLKKSIDSYIIPNLDMD